MDGGGWGSRRSERVTLDELSQRAQGATDHADYEAQVQELLCDALSEFNDRDVDEIGRHLQTIEDALSGDIEGSVLLRFGGSVIKHTYVDGLSDVDMLVHLNDTSLQNKSPDKVMNYFVQRLRQRLPRTDISAGDLAVTVTFSDGHKIQLLPAVKSSSGYRIAASGGKAWSSVIEPARFAERLTQVNKSQNGQVVPTIKLYKAVNESLPKQSRLSGYHIESLAVKAFEGYDGRRIPKHMLRHFCSRAKDDVLAPIVDSTGQSRHADDYLGPANSGKRRQAAQAITNLERKIAKADATNSVEAWEEILSI